jgi:glycine oxidase
MTADCVVIGGGVMGCAIGWRLAQAGVKTVVLERSIPGAEASTAAAGILAGQEEAEGPGPMAELQLASRGLFRELAEELRDTTGIDIGYRESGLLRPLFGADPEAQRAVLDERYRWQRARGLRLQWIDGPSARELEPALAAAAQAALHFPDDAQVDPRPYLKALAVAAAQAGAELVSGAYVRRVLCDGGRAIGVDLEGGGVAAGGVVVAAGSWSSLVEGTGLPTQAVQPMRGQIVQLETRPPAVRGTIVSPRGGYVVGRPDGRVLCGSTMEAVGFEKKVTAGGVASVLAMAMELAPALADAPLTGTWANFRPTSSDRLPILGPSPVDGLFFATGHFRNGILLSAITAELVRDGVLGRAPRLDLGPFSMQRLSTA